MRYEITKTILCSAFVIFAVANHASAKTVGLDSLLNAGLASKMPNSYLSVYSDTANDYAFQWTYSPAAAAIPWTSRDNLVADLVDNNRLDNIGGTVDVGDWHVESGGDPFHSPAIPIWEGLSLAGGTYELGLNPNSGAYNLSAYTWPLELPARQWNAYVQIWVDYGGGLNDSFNFGEFSPAFIKPTEAEALAFYHANVDGKLITLTRDATVYFFLNDGNSLDNAGSILLDINPAPVPLPPAVYLLGSGLVALTRLKRRRRQSRQPA